MGYVCFALFIREYHHGIKDKYRYSIVFCHALDEQIPAKSTLSDTHPICRQLTKDLARVLWFF